MAEKDILIYGFGSVAPASNAINQIHAYLNTNTLVSRRGKPEVKETTETYADKPYLLVFNTDGRAQKFMSKPRPLPPRNGVDITTKWKKEVDSSLGRGSLGGTGCVPDTGSAGAGSKVISAALPVRQVPGPATLSNTTSTTSAAEARALSDKPGTLKPAPQDQTKANVVDKLELGGLQYQNLVKNQRSFTETVDPSGVADRNEVLANYVEISKWPKLIYEYIINFGEVSAGKDTDGNPRTRKITQLRLKKAIMDTLGITPPLNEAKWATDYKSVWSLNPLWDLKDDKESLQLGPVQYHTASGRIEENAPIVTITYSRTLNLPPGEAFDLPFHSQHRDRIVEAMNAFFSKFAKDGALQNNVLLVAANKFFATDVFCELGKKDLLAYRGFSTSVRPTESKLLLGIAPLNSAFYRPVTVKSWIEMLTRNNWKKEEVLQSLVGVRCRLVHNRPKHDSNGPNPNLEENRVKVITEFGKKLKTSNQQLYRPKDHVNTNPLPTVQSCFQDLIDRYASLHEDLDFESADCVNVGIKLRWIGTRAETSKIKRTGNPRNYENFGEALWIPSNLLEIKPYQIYSKLLPPNQTRKMIEFACNEPAVNRAWIENRGLRFLGITGPNLPTENWMERLQLQMKNQLLRVLRTTIEAPKLCFNGSSSKCGPTSLRNGSWNLVNTSFLHGAHVQNVAFIRIKLQGSNQTRINSERIFNRLATAFNTHGITSSIGTTAPPDRRLNLSSIEPENEIQYSRDIWNFFQQIDHAEASSSLFVIILPEYSAGVYAAVKRAADFHGIHTICVLSSKVDRAHNSPTAQYASNLCLKINAKYAKDVHSVKILSDMNLDDVIILGADIGTIKNGAPGTPSVASVVGTVDRNFMNMPGSMRPIPTRSDFIPVRAMTDMVRERLEAWAANHNDKLPGRILMYRDGVSQSQYESLVARADDKDEGERGTNDGDNASQGKGKGKAKAEPKTENPKGETQDGELVAIERAYADAQASRNLAGVPQITFIVVGKRHHTRFFPARQDQADPTGNLHAGTLVNQGVVLANEYPILYNFFLQSHKAIQGTARAAHYVVLNNGMNLSNDEIHRITHALCYAYTRATMAVSYCAPAYHADRMCARGQQYMRDVARRLKSRPYWEQSEPQTSAGYPAWYQQIADNVASAQEWLGDGAHGSGAATSNPWHPRFNNCMFYL